MPSRWFGGVLIAGLLASSAAMADCTSPASFTQHYADGWGIDQRNTRYQPRSMITAANARHLSLKWTYALSDMTPRSYPLVTEDTIVIGDLDHGLVALDLSLIHI